MAITGVQEGIENITAMLNLETAGFLTVVIVDVSVLIPFRVLLSPIPLCFRRQVIVEVQKQRKMEFADAIGAVVFFLENIFVSWK